MDYAQQVLLAMMAVPEHMFTVAIRQLWHASGWLPAIAPVF